MRHVFCGRKGKIWILVSWPEIIFCLPCWCSYVVPAWGIVHFYFIYTPPWEELHVICLMFMVCIKYASSSFAICPCCSWWNCYNCMMQIWICVFQRRTTMLLSHQSFEFCCITYTFSSHPSKYFKVTLLSLPFCITYLYFQTIFLFFQQVLTFCQMFYDLLRSKSWILKFYSMFYLTNPESLNFTRCSIWQILNP